MNKKLHEQMGLNLVIEDSSCQWMLSLVHMFYCILKNYCFNKDSSVVSCYCATISAISFIICVYYELFYLSCPKLQFSIFDCPIKDTSVIICRLIIHFLAFGMWKS